jgi:hypothetical protein
MAIGSCAGSHDGRSKQSTSVEGRWQLALPEDDDRLVVIVTHFKIAGGREGNDAHFAQSQSFGSAEDARFRLAAIGASALRLPPRPALSA